MKFDYLKLANIIKTRRNEKGISTRKLAEKIGISHAEISRFENGLKPSFYLIPFVKMCEELELDIEDLLIEVGLLSEIEDKNSSLVSKSITISNSTGENKKKKSFCQRVFSCWTKAKEQESKSCNATQFELMKMQ